MRAVRFIEGKVVVEDAPEPKGEGVSVRVRACGICGSDLKLLDLGFPLPGIPGHEISGELADGTPVAIEPFDPCGACQECAAGHSQVCAAGKATICGVSRDGGMAEWIQVPASSLVALPRNVDARTGFLVEPLAVAVHGVRLAEVDGRTKVLVTGGGPIGLSAVVAARASGAEVDLIARHSAQKARARQLGANVIESGAGGDYDLVLECAGSDSALQEACEALRPRGRIVTLSTFWGDMTLPGFVLGAKELELRVSSMYGRAGGVRDVDVAASLLGGDPSIADALVSDRFALDEAPAAFARCRDRSGGAVKVVLEP